MMAGGSSAEPQGGDAGENLAGGRPGEVAGGNAGGTSAEDSSSGGTDGGATEGGANDGGAGAGGANEGGESSDAGGNEGGASAGAPAAGNETALSGNWRVIAFAGEAIGGGPYLLLGGGEYSFLMACAERGTYSATETEISFAQAENSCETLELGQPQGATYSYTLDGDSLTISEVYLAELGEVGELVLDRQLGPLPFFDFANDVPQLVDEQFTELEKIEQVSKFRSSAGHDYSDDETCRSMKHYYFPVPAYQGSGDIAVFSPVDGIVSGLASEGRGLKLTIAADEHPAFSFVLFHVDLYAGSTLSVGDSVAAGDLLGSASLPDAFSDFDIAVEVLTFDGLRYVSYFETLTDALFADYQARGATARADFIITEEERDADPLECDNGEFTSTGSLESWVTLDPP